MEGYLERSEWYIRPHKATESREPAVCTTNVTCDGVRQIRYSEQTVMILWNCIWGHLTWISFALHLHPLFFKQEGGYLTLSHNPQQQNSVEQSDKHTVSFKFITPKVPTLYFFLVLFLIFHRYNVLVHWLILIVLRFRIWYSSDLFSFFGLDNVVGFSLIVLETFLFFFFFFFFPVFVGFRICIFFLVIIVIIRDA